MAIVPLISISDSSVSIVNVRIGCSRLRILPTPDRSITTKGEQRSTSSDTWPTQDSHPQGSQNEFLLSNLELIYTVLATLSNFVTEQRQIKMDHPEPGKA